MTIDSKKQHVTPFGRAIFPKLNTPDGKFNPLNPEYSVTLELSRDDPANVAYMAELQKTLDEAYAQAKADVPQGRSFRPMPAPWEESDEYNAWHLKFRLKSRWASRKTGKTGESRVALFDGLKGPVTEEIGMGSIIRVAFEYVVYCMDEDDKSGNKKGGLSLRLRAVQVKELNSGSSGGCAFDAIPPEEMVAADPWEQPADKGEGFNY